MRVYCQAVDKAETSDNITVSKNRFTITKLKVSQNSYRHFFPNEYKGICTNYIILYKKIKFFKVS